jgi:hypothetical protein
VSGVCLLFAVFAVGSALDGRWRDARDSGIPAVLLSGVVVIAWRRMLAQRRRDASSAE